MAFKGRPKHGKLESTVLESVADGLDWLFYIIDYSDVGFQFLAYFFNYLNIQLIKKRCQILEMLFVVFTSTS